MPFTIHKADHVGFVVGSLDAAIGWRPQGTLRAIPTGPRAGTRVIYVVGPSGETIELMQLPA